jgi:hypothetical protein
MPISSLPIPLVREVCHGSRRHTVTAFGSDRPCLVTQAAERRMVVGVALGLTTGLMRGLRSLEFGAGSQINVPIAILIWLMITPMMMKVDFASIRNVGRRLLSQLRRQRVSSRCTDARTAAHPAASQSAQLRSDSIRSRLAGAVGRRSRRELSRNLLCRWLCCNCQCRDGGSDQPTVKRRPTLHGFLLY